MGSNSCDVHHYVRAPLGRIFALDPDYGTVTPLGDRRWIAKDYCSSSASMPTQRAPLSPACAAFTVSLDETIVRYTRQGWKCIFVAPDFYRVAR